MIFFWGPPSQPITGLSIWDLYQHPIGTAAVLWSFSGVYSYSETAGLVKPMCAVGRSKRICFWFFCTKGPVYVSCCWVFGPGLKVKTIAGTNSHDMNAPRLEARVWERHLDIWLFFTWNTCAPNVVSPWRSLMCRLVLQLFARTLPTQCLWRRWRGGRNPLVTRNSMTYLMWTTFFSRPVTRKKSLHLSVTFSLTCANGKRSWIATSLQRKLLSLHLSLLRLLHRVLRPLKLFPQLNQNLIKKNMTWNVQKMPWSICLPIGRKVSGRMPAPF